MSHVRVADRHFPLEHAALVAYHCDGPEADWNLELAHAGQTLWLAGTVRPGPRVADELVDAEVEVDLRSLDEVVGALLGRDVALYPGGQQVCALGFRLARAPVGVRFAVTVECDWDDSLQTFARPGPVVLELEIDAVVAGLHAGALPG